MEWRNHFAAEKWMKLGEYGSIATILVFTVVVRVCGGKRRAEGPVLAYHLNKIKLLGLLIKN